MNQQYTVLVDDEDMSGNYCHMYIGNSACLGGTMVPGPYARPDNGVIDVVFSNTNNKFDILRTIGDYTKGHFEKHSLF
jgi:diacylglycerol kinase family enzyme